MDTPPQLEALGSPPKVLDRFGNNVRRIRLNAGLSQEGLADAALPHRTYIGAIERGERNVSLLSILRLAKGLGVAASELIAGLEI